MWVFTLTMVCGGCGHDRTKDAPQRYVRPTMLRLFVDQLAEVLEANPDAIECPRFDGRGGPKVAAAACASGKEIG
jgi:hypothetical protein